MAPNSCSQLVPRSADGHIVGGASPEDEEAFKRSVIRGDVAGSARWRMFTIGYEHATAPAFLDALARAKVGLLVDVRAVAASRRPGFSKRQLAAALDEHGIAYVHLRPLGTPKEGRLAARAGRAAEMLRIYERHLATAPAREALDELTALAKFARENGTAALPACATSATPRAAIASGSPPNFRRGSALKVEHLFCAPV